MEYSIIACCIDGRQLTGSGYTTTDQVERAIAERARFHSEGTTQLIGIVIVRADGHVIKVDPAGVRTGAFKTEL